jgi:hypothetical protein
MDMGPKHAPPFESKSGSIWTRILALCLDQKKEKLGNLKGKTMGQRLYTKTILKYTMLQWLSE